MSRSLITDPRLLDMPKEYTYHTHDIRHALPFFKQREPAGFSLTLTVQHAPWPHGSRLIGLVKKVDVTDDDEVLEVYAVVAIPPGPPKYVVSIRHGSGDGCAECTVVLDAPPDKHWLREMSLRAIECGYSIEVAETCPVRKSIEEALEQIEELHRDAVEAEEDMRRQRID